MKQKINKQRRDKVRHGNKISISSNDKPVIAVSIQDMQDIIDFFSADKANTLVFYLGAYKDKDDVTDYNQRNTTNWDLKDLENKPTFIIGGAIKNLDSCSLHTDFFDAVTMCPPPTDCVIYD